MPLTFAECRRKPHVTVLDKKRHAAETAIVAFDEKRLTRLFHPFILVISRHNVVRRFELLRDDTSSTCLNSYFAVSLSR